MTDPIVRIGGVSGARAESPRALPQLLRAPINYLMMDYLTETSMWQLARARRKSPTAGFSPEFIEYLKEFLPELKRRRIKVVTNAGGVNPRGCKAQLQSLCEELNLDLSIAAVTGDDVMPLTDALRDKMAREAASEMTLPPRLLSANAYLGALPIEASLDLGADIVVTGRCADSALALGILMHEFKWSLKAYDLLAAGSLVGHLLECGAHGAGGVHTDWEKVPDWQNLGHPIAECRTDGTFVMTKPRDTGGLVVTNSIAEQVLCKIGDPGNYILPDVIADFTQVRLRQDGEHRVHVSGARGRRPTPRYKVSATFQDGYRAVASVSIIGPDAVPKAERTAQALLERARLTFSERGLPDFTGTHVEVLGAESCYGSGARTRDCREVLLRLVVTHADRRCLELFARELGSVGIAFAPGAVGPSGERPKPVPLIRLFTFYMNKLVLTPPILWVGPKDFEIPVDVPRVHPAEMKATVAQVVDAEPAVGATLDVPLIRLAVARSGDKGNTANIAIIARAPEFVAVIRREVTSGRVAEHFRHLVRGTVQRFEAPGLNAFNFLMHDALDGGGMASLRIDSRGQAYGAMALEMSVRVPVDLLPRLEPLRADHT